jgi:hypothetical protein
LKWSLLNADVFEPKSIWNVEPLKLSPGSVALLQRKFDTLKGEALALSEHDRRSNNASTEWHALLLAVWHVDMMPLSQWPTQYHRVIAPKPPIGPLGGEQGPIDSCAAGTLEELR